MPDDFGSLFGTQFTVGGITFFVCENGSVTCDDGIDLGCLEECLEEGKAIMDLTELIQTIDFRV